MYIVYVKHYLNNQGIHYFHTTWFPKVKLIMSQQQGYISVKHDVTRDDNDCVNVIVTFDTQENLEIWAEHPLHDELVIALECYRCREYWEYACVTDELSAYEKLVWDKVIC